jgi:hypothetical protein
MLEPVLKSIFMKQKSSLKYTYSLFVALTMIAANTVSAQTGDWTRNELKYQNTIANLSKYLSRTPESAINQDSLKNYIFIDYGLNSVPQAQRDKRIHAADTLIKVFKHFIDSVGYENLDVKPVQYFKSNSEYYQQFEKELKKDEPNSLAYFNKSSPSLPLGSLLFDEKTGKLMSWIVINQSGYYYYLTFDML